MPDAPRDGDPRFDAEIAPAARRIGCFRPPTEIELGASLTAYQTGDPRKLLRVWREVAEPTRAVVPFPARLFYARAGWFAPRGVNAASWLITVRAGLSAGVRFRESLRPQTRALIATGFPWLEHRHTHIPDGWTPPLPFPDLFRQFIDADDPADVRARWQLAAALNEVQQAAYSHFAAGLFRLPELRRHAAREEAMAICYLEHEAPACTPALWRQVVWVLDALNAAIFDWVVRRGTLRIVGHSLRSALRGDEWRAFVRGLDAPPLLLPSGRSGDRLG